MGSNICWFDIYMMTVLPFGNASKCEMNVLMLLVSMWSLFHCWRIEFSPRRWIDSWQTLWQTVVGIGAKFIEEKEVPPRSCWAHGGLLLLGLWLGGISVLLNPTRSMWGSLIPSWRLLKDCKGSYYFGPRIFSEGPYPPKNVVILVVTVTRRGRIPLNEDCGNL